MVQGLQPRSHNPFFSRKKGLRGPEGPCWLPAEAGTPTRLATLIHNHINYRRGLKARPISSGWAPSSKTISRPFRASHFLAHSPGRCPGLVYRAPSGLAFTTHQLPPLLPHYYRRRQTLELPREGAFYNCKSLTSVYFAGNAPTPGLRMFYSTPATVYYLPGTRGWKETYAGRPTAVWQREAPVLTGAL